MIQAIFLNSGFWKVLGLPGSQEDPRPGPARVRAAQGGERRAGAGRRGFGQARWTRGIPRDSKTP